MNYKLTLTTLYALLIAVDGTINEKEIALGKYMCKAEGFDEREFQRHVDAVRSKDESAVLSECLSDLKKLNSKHQIRSIAWLCVIANADGFMDKKEWQFIYDLYHKELNLPLSEIFNVQKELSRAVRRDSREVGVTKIG
jgi:uncharacterized tellurite resistance protein B-like protein